MTQEKIGTLIDSFYARVRLDPELGPVFNAAVHDWPGHLARLKDFWSSVMLTSGRYKGNPMAVHLRHAGSIAPEMFDRWLGLWRETAQAVMPAEEAAVFIEKAERIAESLKLGLFFRIEGMPGRPSAA
ncbi:MAG: group III truncated hemoglobin [Allosphingosinicella sp.]